MKNSEINKIILKYKFMVLGSALAALCVGLTGITFGTIIKLIVDNKSTNLLYYINLMLVFSFIFSVFSFTRSYFSNILSEKITYDITFLLYDKLTKAKAEIVKKFSSSYINIIFIEDVEVIKKFLASQVSFLVRNIVLFISGMLLMIKTSLFFFVILIFTAILVAIMLVIFLSLIKKYTQKINTANVDIMQHIFQGIAMQKVLQIFNPDDLKNQDFQNKAINYANLNKRKQFYRALMFAVITFFVLVSIVYSTYRGMMMVSANIMTSGQFMSFLIYMIIVISSLIGISNFRNEREGFMNSVTKIEEILALTAHKNGNTIPPNNNIVIENLCYKNIFNNFSTKIAMGTSAVIVGKSGSGKSTLSDLLLGFISLDKGNILIGNVKIEDIDINYWHCVVSFCPQITDIFDITVKKNIFYGKNFDSDLYEKIINDLNLTNIKNVENDKLSVGEKQRICIARALLKTEAKVFIFDEPTSALDITNTSLIFQVIKKYTHGKTLIIITHEQVASDLFDQIINIETI